jgi:hypothetical protein
LQHEGALWYKDNRGKWKERYASFDIVEMKIYKALDKGLEMASILLRKCELSISVAQKRGDKLKSYYRFSITEHSGLTHDFAATSEDDRRIWMQLLEQTLETESGTSESATDADESEAGQRVSCDYFQEDPACGFLRCARCTLKRVDHFSPWEVQMRPHMASVEGWLHVRREGPKRSSLSSEWMQRYGRLRNMTMCYTNDPRINDNTMVIPLDLRCHLVRYDGHDGKGVLSTKYIFSISTTKGVFMFATDTAVDRENWLRGLISCFSFAFVLQEARIKSEKSILDEMEASTSHTSKDVRMQRRKISGLEEVAGVEPTIFNETDVKISKLKRLAERLSQASEDALIDFIENGGLAKLCNTLRRLCEQAMLTDNDVSVESCLLKNTHSVDAVTQLETQKGLVQCFRAIMNHPVGMEEVVRDTEPLELMGTSVFLAPSPELWLIQSVRRDFSRRGHVC